MIFGVLERLFVIHDQPTRLVLREYPLLAWLFGGAFIIGSGTLAVLGSTVSALMSLVLGAAFFLWAQTRTLTFDRATGQLTVRLWAPLRQSQPLAVALTALQRAAVKPFASGHTQIVLHFQDGRVLGLSVYSSDIADWKTPLVERINAILT